MAGTTENFVDGLRREIVTSLSRSALSYYRIGIEQFFKLRNQPFYDYQPAVGLLCISVELLLKAVVGKKAFRHLYQNLPTEVQILLTYPDSIAGDARPRVFANDLRSFVFKAVELNDAISLFYSFYPEKKQEYKPYLSILSSIRNVSVHAALPSFERYHLDRVAYIATQLFLFMETAKALDYLFVRVDAEVRRFVESYEDERVQRVAAAINDAKASSKKLNHLGSHIFFSDDPWDLYFTECPVCNSGGTVDGYTEHYIDGGQHHLSFFCDAFRCDECGLELLDTKELELAGMDTVLDRRDEVDRWLKEHYYEE